MAIIIEGKFKDKSVVIRDFCNDWITVSHPEIPYDESKLSPTALEYRDDEIERINESGDKGIFAVLFQWNGRRLIRKPKAVKV